MTLISKTLHVVGLLPILAACLPVDDRPPPGHAVVTVSTDENLANEVTTKDGWTIHYARFLLSLGNVWLNRISKGPACDEYSMQFYLRILDLRRPAPQTLRTLFARGECVMQFTLLSPLGVESGRRPDVGPEQPTVVTDVSEADQRLMNAVGSDAFTSGGVVLSVAGTATRADTMLSFDWSFRQSLHYESCETIRFIGDTSQTLDIRMNSRFLFHDRLDPDTAEVLFEPYAAADADADGTITLEELGAVPLDGSTGFGTLAERLYLGLVPRLPEFGGRPACLSGSP